MPLPSPNLDDRTFDQLIDDAVKRVKSRNGAWQDLSIGDPGFVLLDVFAYLTDQLLYRVNRIPEKAYVAFLNLVGAKLYAPSAATVVLTFSQQQPAATAVRIPRGTQVSAQRAGDGSDEPIVFSTVDDAEIPKGSTSVDVRAHHVDLFTDEPVGVGTGGASQSVTVAHAPIVAATGDAADVLVAVEMQPGESKDRVNARMIDGVAYRVWEELQSFADASPSQAAYVLDRASGTITFAPSVQMSDSNGGLAANPSLLALVPASGAHIRVSYATGGGSRGNVATGTLTVLKTPIPGIAVTNAGPATGGRAGETLANALVRGPREFESLQRAVTARDFELIAQTETGAVARAKAYAKREVWNYAAPGTVEVLLVPEYLSPDQRGNGAVTAAKLAEQQTSETISQIGEVLDARRPLGIACSVNWVHYKTVKVVGKLIVARGEDPNAVRDRILARLHLLINPLPTTAYAGWPFGRTLRISDVVAIILGEPGVRYYDSISLVLEDAPDANVSALASDPTQPHMWLGASAGSLYRTLNDGDGWEPIGTFAAEEIVRVVPSVDEPGTIAMASKLDDGTTASIIRISPDAGDTWTLAARMENLHVTDLEWILREQGVSLLIATDKGLYELAITSGAVPVQIEVHKDDSKFGFSAVRAVRVRGVPVVAVAAQAQGGIYLSNRGGADGSFVQWGLAGETIQVLSVQHLGESTHLWAGFAAAGAVAGDGCSRRELTGADPAIDPSTWQALSTGWSGGSVMDLAYANTIVYAASHDAGVLFVDSNAQTPSWQTLPLSCGLPVREKAGFQIVSAIASAGSTVLAGGPAGVYRSTDGKQYVNTSNRTFEDQVVLPMTWLFVSGSHEIEVRSEGG